MPTSPEPASARPVVVGCTGGIGAGKSTVAARLAEHGARVVDADALARRVLAPGTPSAAAVLARFGADVRAPDGTVARERLAAVVFADPVARRALEEIVHPAVRAEIGAVIAASGSGDVVVIDAALLVETDGRARYGLDGLLVVDAPEDLVLARLSARGLGSADAAARIAAQASRAERIHAADYVIVNCGTLAELNEMADAAWSWIAALAAERQADQVGSMPGDSMPGDSRRGDSMSGEEHHAR